MEGRMNDFDRKAKQLVRVANGYINILQKRVGLLKEEIVIALKNFNSLGLESFTIAKKEHDLGSFLRMMEYWVSFEYKPFNSSRCSFMNSQDELRLKMKYIDELRQCLLPILGDALLAMPEELKNFLQKTERKS